MHQPYDVTIIGGGPVGLFTAFYSGMRQMKTKVIESLPQLGGQLATLYPEKYIYDIAGFPKVKAQKLVDRLLEQANEFDPTYVLGETVIAYERMDDGIIRLVTNKGEHYTKTVILTAGNGSFAARPLGVADAERFEETNLHYFVNDMERFKDRQVVLLGGGDSAVDWSLMLEPIAKSVTLVHRRDKFRAHEHSVELLHDSSVNVMTPYTLESVTGETHIETLTFKHAESGEVVVVAADDVVCNFGFVSSLGPLKEWEVEFERNSIRVNSKMETAIPGVFACGDIATYEGRVKLIATGFGEAPIAVNQAKLLVDPSARHPQHSTSLFEKVTNHS